MLKNIVVGGILCAAMVLGSNRPVRAADRFEVTSIKAVRPTLVNTVDALQKSNLKAAKDAFASFDSAWNGIEVYIDTRSMEMYDTLERQMQAKLTAGLNEANPNVPDLLAQAKAMLAKFDEAIAMVEHGDPLNPLYDDVARLRIVRAHLREVNPAMKLGNLDKARRSFDKFDAEWDNIEDLVKVRSREAYDTIEQQTDRVAGALKQPMPDVDRVTSLVSGIMDDTTKSSRRYSRSQGPLTLHRRSVLCLRWPVSSRISPCAGAPMGRRTHANCRCTLVLAAGGVPLVLTSRSSLFGANSAATGVPLRQMSPTSASASWTDRVI